jgi:hypothetical protein
MMGSGYCGWLSEQIVPRQLIKLIGDVSVFAGFVVVN